MNIYETFEQFFSLPMSLIRQRVIQVLHVETNIFANATRVNVETFDNTTQVTVLGSKKVYNLLNTVLQKKKMMQNDNKNRQIYNNLP